MRKKPRVLSEMIQMLDDWLFLEENLRETEESGVQPQVPRMAIHVLFLTMTHVIGDAQLPDPLMGVTSLSAVPPCLHLLLGEHY